MAEPHGDVILLDGATGTELGRRGMDISPPLWSARALLAAPETLEQVHREYLEAGADAIITCTFRTHRRSLDKVGLGDRAEELTHRAVEIARQVRDRIKPEAKVLGSVAPLEDCYSPKHAPRAELCRYEHERMISSLLDAGVDMIAIETMGTLREAEAAADIARELAAGKWMISFLTGGRGRPGVLLSGESLVDLLPLLHEAWAVGVNCLPATNALSEVKLLRRLLPPTVRVSCYANTGEQHADDDWQETDAADPARYAAYARQWIEAGATVVGGCCGTRPETIRMVARAVGRE
jgi:S-methylmethionine-dependent homocysteine/selenocysteine methylase